MKIFRAHGHLSFPIHGDRDQGQTGVTREMSGQSFEWDVTRET